MTDIVGKLWGFCHPLRHDGIDYGDYIEQLTYLLFLKMVEEKRVEIPSKYSWSFLPERAALKAGRIMLEQIHSLGNRGLDFGFETTLS